jgi:hypothetical protein
MVDIVLAIRGVVNPFLGLILKFYHFAKSLFQQALQ